MNKVILLILITSLIISCETRDLCDDGYTEVDGFCIPDYVVGDERNLEFGNTFYHIKHGVITYESGNWINKDKDIIQILNN